VEPNDLVSQSEAAKRLVVSRQVISERLKAGTLTPYKDGFGIVRVSWAEVCEYQPRKSGRPKKAEVA